MGRPNPRKYSAEFKRQAVDLAKQLGSDREAGAKLGIPSVNIHNWREKIRLGAALSDDASRAHATETPDEELKRLRRENQQLQKANYILKQAAAFFSQDHLK